MIQRIDKEGLRRYVRPVWIVAVLLPFAVVFLYVWLYAHVLAVSAEIETTETECAKLRNRVHDLIGEKTRLSSLERIGPLAEKELGMVRVDGSRVRRILVEDGLEEGLAIERKDFSTYVSTIVASMNGPEGAPQGEE